MRTSNHLIGMLNFLTFLLSIPILGGGIWLSTRVNNSDCLTFLQYPLIVIGVAIMVVSLAGFAGACYRNTFLMYLYLWAMFLIICVLIGFVIFAYVVTDKGSGRDLMNRGYKDYYLPDYSGWLKDRVSSDSYWRKISSCVRDSGVCRKSVRVVNGLPEAADDYYRRKLAPIEIWIFETFPNSIQWWSKDSKKIPRGLAWSKFKNFEKKHYRILFDPAFKPIKKLLARNDEAVLTWYIRSMEYIRGLQLQVTLVHATNMSVEPVAFVQPDDGIEHYFNMDNDSTNADDDADPEVGGEGNDGEGNDQGDVNIDDHGVEGNESGAGVGGGVDVTGDGDGSGVLQEDSIDHDMSYRHVDENVEGPNEHHVEGENVSDKDEVGLNEHHVEGENVSDKDELSQTLDRAKNESELNSIKSTVEGENVSDKDEVGPNEHHVEGENVSDKDELAQTLDRGKIESELNSIKSTVGGIEERVGDVDVSNLLVEIDILKKRVGVLEDVLGVRFEQKSVVLDDESEDVHADTPTPKVRVEKTQDVVSDNKIVRPDVTDDTRNKASVVQDGDTDTQDVHADTPNPEVRDNKTVRPDVTDDTPNKASVVEDDVHKLFYTDTQAFQGPMTQLMKAALPSPTDPCTEFMQLDNNSRFDFSSLPNLNDAFSESVDLTPHSDTMDLDVDKKQTDEEGATCKDYGVGTQQQPNEDMPETAQYDLMDTNVDKNETDPNVEKEVAEIKEATARDVCEKSGEPQGGVGNGDDKQDEVIYIDVEVDTETSQAQNMLSSDINVVLVNNVRSIFNGLKRKRNPGKFNRSPYTTPPDTTPRVLRRLSSRNNRQNISPPIPPDFGDALQLPPLEPFVENLVRYAKGRKQKMNCIVPPSIRKFIDNGIDIKFIFPWGNEDTFADIRFWKCLLADGDCRDGWLRDEHVDVWVDLLWTFRQPDADWAIAGTFFSAGVMANNIRSYWANGVKYPVPWTDVEKVLFPINEPREHWATGELHIRTGVITLYDTLPKYSKRREWWKKTMPQTFAKNLGNYLKEQGVLQAKGIDVDGYEITWKDGMDVPKQGCLYGDCGVWVCIILYRLANNMSLQMPNPTLTAIAYRERIADYLWKYKVQW